MMSRELLQQQMHPERDAVTGLGDQSRRQRGHERSRHASTLARGTITTSANPSPIRPHLDLDDFGIFAVGHRRKRLAALRTHTLLGRQYHRLLDHRQMRIVPPTRAGSLRLLTAPPLGLFFGGLQIVESERMLGAVVFFRLGSVEPIFQLSVFAAKQVDFPLKFLPLFHRPSMHRPPVADLLPQVDDFSA